MIYGTYKFKEIFPKTFAYLEFYVPLRHPKYLDKLLPNPTVILKDQRGNYFKRIFGDAQAQVNILTKNITIYLKPFLEENAYYNFEKLNLQEQRNLVKILKLLDSQPRFQTTLIHEYEHCVQLDIGITNSTRFSKNIGLKNSNPFQLSAKGIMGGFSKKYQVEYILAFYNLKPREVEARLAEWIFLKVKKYDELTISALDFVLKKDLQTIKRDYDSILLGIQELEKNKRANWKELDSLYRKKYYYENYLRYYPKIIEESERIAKLFHEKYIHATQLNMD